MKFLLVWLPPQDGIVRRRTTLPPMYYGMTYNCNDVDAVVNSALTNGKTEFIQSYPIVSRFNYGIKTSERSFDHENTNPSSMVTRESLMRSVSHESLSECKEYGILTDNFLGFEFEEHVGSDFEFFEFKEHIGSDFNPNDHKYSDEEDFSSLGYDDLNPLFLSQDEIEVYSDSEYREVVLPLTVDYNPFMVNCMSDSDNDYETKIATEIEGTIRPPRIVALDVKEPEEEKHYNSEIDVHMSRDELLELLERYRDLPRTESLSYEKLGKTKVNGVIIDKKPYQKISVSRKQDQKSKAFSKDFADDIKERDVIDSTLITMRSHYEDQNLPTEVIDRKIKSLRKELYNSSLKKMVYDSTKANFKSKNERRRDNRDKDIIVSRRRSEFRDFRDPSQYEIDMFIQRTHKSYPFTESLDVIESFLEIPTLIKKYFGNVEFIEKIFCGTISYIYSVINVKDYASMISVTYLYVTSLGLSITKVASYIKNYLSEHEDLFSQFWTLNFGSTESLSDNLDYIRTHYWDFLTGNCVKALRNFILGLVSFNLFGDDWTTSFIKYLGKPAKKGLMETIDSIFKQIIVLVRCGESLISGIPFSSIMLSDCPEKKCRDEMKALLFFRDKVYSGMPVEGMKCRREFVEEGQNLVKTCKEILKYKLEKKIKKELKELQYNLEESLIEHRTLLNNSMRIAPQVINIVGLHGIGKSEIINLHFKAHARTRNRVFKDGMVFHRGLSTEYWDGYHPIEHVYGHYSELGSKTAKLAQTQGDERILEFLSVCDSVPMYVNMAKLESKGVTAVLMELLVNDMNLEDMNVPHIMRNSAAVFRRMIFVEPTVKEEFRQDGSHMIDIKKSLSSNKHPYDRWTFKVFKFVMLGENVGQVTKTYITGSMDYLQYLEWLNVYFVDHLKNQEILRSVMSDVDLPPLEKDRINYVEPLTESKDLYDPIYTVSMVNLYISREMNDDRYTLEDRTGSDDNSNLKFLYSEYFKDLAMSYILTEGYNHLEIISWIERNNFKTIVTKYPSRVVHVKPFLAPDFKEFYDDIKYREEQIALCEVPLPNGFSREPQDDCYKRKKKHYKKPTDIELEEASKPYIQSMWKLYINKTWNKMSDFEKVLRFLCQHHMEGWLDWIFVMLGNFLFGPLRVFSRLSSAFFWYTSWYMVILMCSPLKNYLKVTSKFFPILCYIIAMCIFVVVPCSFLIPLFFFFLGFCFPDLGDVVFSLILIYCSKKKDFYYDIILEETGFNYVMKPFESKIWRKYGDEITASLTLLLLGLTGYKLFKKSKPITQTDFMEDNQYTQTIIKAEMLSNANVGWKAIPNKNQATYNFQQEYVSMASFNGSPESLESVIRFNIRKVRIHNSAGKLLRAGNLLGLCEDYCIINTHSFAGLVDPILCYSETGNITDTTVFKQVVLCSNNYVNLGGDLSIVKLSGTLFRNITHFFSTDDYLKINYPLRIKNTKYIGSVYGELKLQDTEIGVVHVRKAWSMKLNNLKSGDCGLPVIVDKHDCGSVIGGIHVGSDNEWSYSTLISREVVESGIDLIKKRDSTFPKASHGDLPVTEFVSPLEKSPFRYEVVHSVSYFGKMPGNVNVNNDSKVRKTLIFSRVPEFFKEFDLIQTKHFGKPLMRDKYIDGVYVNPKNVMLRKVDKTDLAMSQELINDVVNTVSNQILKNLREKGVTLLQPFELQTAVNGIHGNPFCRKINPHTGSGFGFSGKKHKYLPLFSEDPYYREPNEELSKLVSQRIKRAELGLTYGNIYRAQLKDEARAVKNIKIGKTRVFYMSPLDALVHSKMYLGPLFTLMHQYGECFYSAVGIDMYRDALKFLEYITMDFSNSDTIWDGDFGDFDITGPFQVKEAVATVIYNVLQGLGYNHYSLNQVRSILTDMLFPLVDLDLDLYMKAGLQPSGGDGTTEINCLVITVLLVIAWKTHPMLREHDFFANVRHRTNGDDSITNQEPWCSQYFNATYFKSVCENYFKMNYTPASKDNNLESPFSGLVGTSFLKRTFSYREDIDMWVAKLDPNSIMRSLMWSIPSKHIPNSEQIHACLKSACYELALHLTEGDFNLLVSKLRSYVSFAYFGGLEIETPSFWEIINNFKGHPKNFIQDEVWDETRGETLESTVCSS
jgi:hypothetical protein